MPTITEELYLIDEALSKNPSVGKLIEIIQPMYMVATKLTEQYADKPELHESRVNIGKINSMILGISPEEGPVLRLGYGLGSKLKSALEEGLIVKDEDYIHDDTTGKAMIQFSLTKDEMQLKKHGLEHLNQGHAIYLYLEPL